MSSIFVYVIKGNALLPRSYFPVGIWELGINQKYLLRSPCSMRFQRFQPRRAVCYVLFSLPGACIEGSDPHHAPSWADMPSFAWTGSHLPSCCRDHFPQDHSLQLQSLTVFFQSILRNNLAAILELNG